MDNDARSRIRRTLALIAFAFLPACASDEALRRANAGCPPAQAGAQSKYAAAAFAYLKANPGAHRVSDPARELSFLCEEEDALKHKHARFQQSHQAIPVWGQQVIVHFDAQDRATSHSGSIEPIGQALVTKPKLDSAAAAANAVKAAGEGWRAGASSLYFYPRQPVPRLAHLVNVSKGLQRAMIFIDAETGVVLNEISASPTK